MARRKSDQRKVCNDFYIITNGEKTEKFYFDLLRKAKHSLYSVHVIFENADPYKLVEYAKNFCKTANQVWCVFDIDYNYQEGRLIPALKFAKENDIKIAYSNKAFDDYIDIASTNKNNQIRMHSLHLAENVFMNDNAIIPIYFYSEALLVSPKLKGVEYDSQGLYRFFNAYLEFDAR